MQVYQAWISNCIPQYSVLCNYLSMPEIPTPGTKVLTYVRVYLHGIQTNNEYQLDDFFTGHDCSTFTPARVCRPGRRVDVDDVLLLDVNDKPPDRTREYRHPLHSVGLGTAE